MNNPTTCIHLQIVLSIFRGKGAGENYMSLKYCTSPGCFLFVYQKIMSLHVSEWSKYKKQTIHDSKNPLLHEVWNLFYPYNMGRLKYSIVLGHIRNKIYKHVYKCVALCLLSQETRLTHMNSDYIFNQTNTLNIK